MSPISNCVTDNIMMMEESVTSSESKQRYLVVFREDERELVGLGAIVKVKNVIMPLGRSVSQQSLSQSNNNTKCL